MISIKIGYEKVYDCLSYLPRGSGNSSSKPFINALIHSLELSGHAGVALKGADPVCAAISSAVIAFSTAVSMNPKIGCQCKSAGRGEFLFLMDDYSEDQRFWLAGLTSMLTESFNRVAKEYPDSIYVELIETE